MRVCLSACVRARCRYDHTSGLALTVVVARPHVQVPYVNTRLSPLTETDMHTHAPCTHASICECLCRHCVASWTQLALACCLWAALLTHACALCCWQRLGDWPTSQVVCFCCILHSASAIHRHFSVLFLILLFILHAPRVCVCVCFCVQGMACLISSVWVTITARERLCG